MKINTNSMKKVYEALLNTFCKKNHDYGNSFELSLDKHGLVAGVVRMEDKMNRLSTLVDSDTDAQIASESLVDTLMDLSNYAAMSACWLMGQDEETRDEYYAKHFHKLSTVARNSTYGVEDENTPYEYCVKNFNKLTNYGVMSAFEEARDEIVKNLKMGINSVSGMPLTTRLNALMKCLDVMEEDEKTHDEEATESGKFTGLKVWGDDTGEGFSGSITTTMGKEKFEEFEKTLHLASFEGYQEKVNERDDISDEEIIKNWGLVGDSKTVRSRTTGYYLVEDDNPELFRKIIEVLKAQKNHKNFTASWKPAPEDIISEPQQFATELKGLENGYFIRQHINSDNSYRYTIAFNPEGTIKVDDGVAKPYVIECFGNDYDGMNVWAIHVFDTREDMVYALNYDLRVRDTFKSKNLGDSIKGLDIEISVYAQYDAPLVFETWYDTFGQAFDKQMTSKGLGIEKYFELHQGIKTFGPVFISEKTGALIVKGNIREASFKRSCDFIWFSDTKEVLLEVDDTTPKFNYDGVLYGVIYTYENNEYIDINPLYESMSMKIMSRFNSWHAWSGSELKNLVFFNEDYEVESGDLTSKNGELKIDFEDSDAYWDKI